MRQHSSPAGTAAAPAMARTASGEFVAATEALQYATGPAPSFLDITDDVCAVVERLGVRAGQATIFSQHTTAAIRVNENEPLLLRDLARLLWTFVPQHAYYEHNDFDRRTVNMNDDECRNGHAHCQHLLLGASETVPIVDGRLALGTYQRIFLVELDHPRSRRVLISVVGIR
jgi:secondary thiamine-phosphate synthase enzyme